MNPDLKDARILIVDDQSANVKLIEEYLIFSGYTHVKSTTDSREAVNLVESFQPHLLLLDLMMPYLSGYQILEQLKGKMTNGVFMPILVLTSDNSDEAKRKSLSEGANDFLIKPFDPIEVGLRIKNLLFSVYLFSELKNSNIKLEEKVLKRTKELQTANHKLTVAKNLAEDSEERYRMLFNSNLDSITVFYFDEKGNTSSFIEANKAASELLEYNAEEFEQIRIDDIEDNESDREIKNRYTELYEKGRLHFETVFRKKSGVSCHVEVEAVKLELKGKTAAMFIARDITEKREYLEAIKSQNKVLKEIAWTQSHVVRAPLARMLGVIALLEDDGCEDFSKSGMIDIITDSAAELDEIIREISQKTYASKIFD